MTMTQGQSVPTLTSNYTIAGFLLQDTQISATTGLPAVTTTATSSSKAGSYVITCAQGSLTSTNYQLNYNNGTLTILPNPSTSSSS
jgi:hypothetical protein